MTAREFRGWCLYLDREPSVGDRLDWWLGQILAAILNLFRRTPVKAADLTPDRWGDRTGSRSARLRGKDLADALKALFGGGGGTERGR